MIVVDVIAFSDLMPTCLMCCSLLAAAADAGLALCTASLTVAEGVERTLADCIQQGDAPRAVRYTGYLAALRSAVAARIDATTDELLGNAGEWRS